MKLAFTVARCLRDVRNGRVPVHTRSIAFSVVIALGACSEDTASLEQESGEIYQSPRAQREPTVAGYSLSPVVVIHEQTGPAFQPPAPIWPSAAVVDVALPDATLLVLYLAPR